MRARYLVGVAVVAVGVASVVFAAGLPYGTDNGAEASSLPAATAPVTRQTLVDVETHSGQLGYGEVTERASRLSGTVTAMAEAGSTVKRGDVLYRVDNKPVVLLYGALPAYRKIGPGDDGRDVKQLESNLWALGYRGFTVDKSYTSATAEAVEEWQDEMGVAETGSVDPASLVYAPAAVRIDSRSVAIGDVVQPGTALLSTTDTERVATVPLDIEDDRLAGKGDTVTVKLPDGKESKGRIVDVVTEVTPEQGQEPAQTALTVTVNGFESNGLDQAAVDVDFTSSQRKDVLTVPVAALLALAEGGYGLEIVDGTTTRIIAVKTGLFAASRVEVSGGGLVEGMTVGTPK